MADYITFIKIQTVRSGKEKNEMLVVPPLYQEIFPNIPSFDSSLILSDHFADLAARISPWHAWRSWVLLFKKPEPDGSSNKEPFIDVKLIRPPVTVFFEADQHLRTVTSAFDKQQTVGLKVTSGSRHSSWGLILSDIELLQDR